MERAVRAVHIGPGVSDDLPAVIGDAGIYFLTYTLERSATAGELTPEFAEGDVMFRPVDAVLSMTDRTRESDRERIEMAWKRRAE